MHWNYDLNQVVRQKDYWHSGISKFPLRCLSITIVTFRLGDILLLILALFVASITHFHCNFSGPCSIKPPWSVLLSNFVQVSAEEYSLTPIKDFIWELMFKWDPIPSNYFFQFQEYVPNSEHLTLCSHRLRVAIYSFRVRSWWVKQTSYNIETPRGVGGELITN